MEMLVLSDTHIPDRKEDFPEWVKELIEKRWDVIVHLGDATSEWVYHYLSYYADKLILIKGNSDFPRLYLKQWDKLEDGTVTYYFIHGHQAGRFPSVEHLIKLLNVDIDRPSVIFFGHTHLPTVVKIGSVTVVNPGTATGAQGYFCERIRPSLITVKDNILNLVMENKVFQFRLVD